MLEVELQAMTNGGVPVYSWGCPLCLYELRGNYNRAWQLAAALDHLTFEHRVIHRCLEGGSVKVSYTQNDGNVTTAYLDEEKLTDGSYVGRNKHTEVPVHLRPIVGGWVTVCEREVGGFDRLTEQFDVGPAPEGCTCREKVDGGPTKAG